MKSVALSLLKTLIRVKCVKVIVDQVCCTEKLLDVVF